jgi:hypothetical protein
MTIAGQRFGKYVFEVTQSTLEGPPLLGSQSLGTFHSNNNKKKQIITEELIDMAIYEYIQFTTKL